MTEKFASKPKPKGRRTIRRQQLGSDQPSRPKANIRSVCTMSALPPKADMCGATRDVRFGPKADIS
jgi:hypothetical protein